MLLDEIALVKRELFGKSLLEVGSRIVEFKTSVETVAEITCVELEGKRVLEKETDGIIVLDKVEKFPCVLETAVEFTMAELLDELGDKVTKDEFDTMALVKSGVNVELVNTLVTRKLLSDEFVLITEEPVTFTLDLTTPIEVVAMTVRLLVKVLGNVRLSLVSVGENADVDIVVNDDLSILDVEFISAVLLVVLEFTDITTLDKFKLVARGEAVNDDKTIAVDVAFGCKAELVKFLMMDVMFTLTDLDENTTVLDGRNKELDKIMLELLNDSGNEELVFMTELLILLNVGTMVLNVGTILLTDGTLLFNVGTTLLNDV